MNALKIFLSVLIIICAQIGVTLRAQSKISDKAIHEQHSLSIRVECRDMPKIDSLYIYFLNSFRAISGEEDIRPMQSAGDHTFEFSDSRQRPYGQFVIRAKAPEGTTWAQQNKRIALTRSLYWEAGDNMTIVIQKKHSGNLTGSFMDDYHFNFKGTGAEKYTVAHNVFQSYYATNPGNMDWENQVPDKDYQDLEAPRIEAALSHLEAEREHLPDLYYQLIKADYIAKQVGRFARLKRIYENDAHKGGKLNKEILKEQLNTRIDPMANGIPDTVKARSSAFINYLHEKLLFESFLCDSIPGNKDYVTLIANRYKGLLRDKLLLNLIVYDKGKQNLNEIYRKASVIIDDPDCLQLLQNSAGRLRGKPVFDFRLPDINGRPVRLASLKGKVIFIDLWFSNCGACAAYYRNVLKEAEEKLGTERDIAFVSISADRSKTVWKQSVASGRHTSDQAINLYTDGKGAMHEWLMNYGFSAFPTFMIIDKHGNIYHIYEDRFMDDINSSEALLDTLNRVINMQ
jgi:cytochrome oxidase Cu insertion factor (SCO1/SenC/PrrC family)